MARPRTTTDLARDRVRAAYGGAVGKTPEQLVTPALTLDIQAARRNIQEMGLRIAGLPAELRPHIKVHKSPDLAQMQIEAGAIGVSTATVWEAMVMAEAGVDDILIANTIAGAAKIRAVTNLARLVHILVAVDDIENARLLSEAAQAAGSTLGVLIEVDTGMDRAGVDSAEDALALARGLVRLPGLRFEGLTGYEGHCSRTRDRDERARNHATAMSFLSAVSERLIVEGFPVEIRSAGGTVTWEWTAAFPGITEVQAGSYVLMDNFHGSRVPGFEQALMVGTTVISRPPGRLIIDAGEKSVGAPELSTVFGHDLEVVRFDEEHGIFRSPDHRGPQVGDTLQLVPGYSPSTVNLYDAYHVIENDVVVDIWPVVPRGPGHLGLIAE